jgi:hypothetical protein
MVEAAEEQAHIQEVQLALVVLVAAARLVQLETM